MVTLNRVRLLKQKLEEERKLGGFSLKKKKKRKMKKVRPVKTALVAPKQRCRGVLM